MSTGRRRFRRRQPMLTEPASKLVTDFESALPPLRPEQALDVFKLGRCTDVIDIFDEEALREARIHYSNAYYPALNSLNRQRYEVAGTKPMDLFPYFHLAIYKRNQD